MLTIVIAILLRLTIGVFSKAENWGRFYEPPGITINLSLVAPVITISVIFEA